MLKRVFFIYNRVVGSQILFLFLTSIITTITGFYGSQESFLVIWYIFIFIIPIITIILMYVKRYWLHYFRHWTIILLPLSIIWLSPTFSLGILVDKISGLGKTFAISIAICLLYLIGYGFARLIRMDKVYSKFNKKRKLFKERIRINLFLIVFGFSTTLILVTFFTGWWLLNNELKTRGIDRIFNYREFMSCLECALYSIYMFSGLLISAFLILHYFSLIGLFNIENSSVQKDTPNRLILIFLRNSIIVTFICWILSVFLIPPLPLGGKGGGSGGGGGVGGAGGSGVGSSGSRRSGYRKMQDIIDELNLKDELWDRYNLLD